MSDKEHGEHDEHGGGKGGGGHGGGHGKGGHGGGGHEEHEEGVPEWVVSFADNALLQMGFFAILLALNMGAKAKGPVTDGDGNSSAPAKDSMMEFVLAIREGFNNPVDPNGTGANDAPAREYMRKRDSAGETREAGPDGDKKDAQTVRPSDYKAPSGYVEFDDQSTSLSETGRNAIVELSHSIVGTRWMVEVRGHVSAREALGDTKKARELSYARAWEVGAALVAQGAKWPQIRLVACGDSDPVKPRASGNDHATNQRAEVFTLPETMPPDPFSKESSGGGER